MSRHRLSLKPVVNIPGKSNLHKYTYIYNMYTHNIYIGRGIKLAFFFCIFFGGIRGWVPSFSLFFQQFSSIFQLFSLVFQRVSSIFHSSLWFSSAFHQFSIVFKKNLAFPSVFRWFFFAFVSFFLCFSIFVVAFLALFIRGRRALFNNCWVYGSCYFVLVVLLLLLVVVVSVVVLFLSQLFLCLSIYLSFNNCCGCGGCGCVCGCCGCRRRRLPSKGRVGLIKKNGWGARCALPPQCVLCDLHPGVVFLHCLDRFWWCHLLDICYCLLLLLLLLLLFWRQAAPISIAVIPLSIFLSLQ